MTLRFASIGSGSKGNCLVAEVGDTRVLLDCGLTPRETERRLARIGLKPADITGILVTHEHDDHAGQAYPFAAQHRLPVWLTYGTQAALAESGKLPGEVETRTIDGRTAFSVGGIEVRPYTVPHDAREPVQFVLSDGAFRLGVLTDIGASTAHVEATLSGCDALVLECNHDSDMLWAGDYPEMAEGAHRRAVRAPVQRRFREIARGARPLAPEARLRGAPVAPEQPAGTRPRSARPRDGLRAGLDRPVHPGGRLRLARTALTQAPAPK